MKEAVRVVLVDPSPRSRHDLVGRIGEINGVGLVEVCSSYQASAPRISALLPEIAVIVLDEDIEQAMELVQHVAHGHPEVSVVPAGTGQDAGVILHAVRSGAKEYLPLPADPVELLEVVNRLRPQDSSAPAEVYQRSQVIAVTGAAGGVGCTSVAVNLAATVAKQSQRDTVLADFDLLLGSLEECLAVVPDNSLEVIARNIDEMSPTLLKRWLPRHASGLYVLPHQVSMEEAARVEPDPLRRVLDLLTQSFATVVIDTSKGLQQTDFLAFESADLILVVLQLNLNCTRNTVRLLQYLRQFEGFEAKVRLVVNRLNSPLSEISVRKAEELLKTPVQWHVPNSTRLFRPARVQGIPIDEVEGGESSKVHEAFLSIVREIQPQPNAAKARKRLFSAFR
jgi:pilus assembly protein CpaE